MCCTQKEMAAEGKKIPTDRWYQVKHVPCCVKPKQEQVLEHEVEERKTGQDTGVPCHQCKRNTYRLLRVVRTAEKHGGEKLPVPTCETECPQCGHKMAWSGLALEIVARQNGVDLHILTGEEEIDA